MVGTWEFTREIRDRVTAELHRVAGTMELVAEGADRVRWSESGVMTWRGSEVPVSRTLGVVARDGGWLVTFEDGRDFHPWTPGVEVEHPCGQDLYVGRVDVAEVTGSVVTRWTVAWHVTGPAKDYDIATVVTRRAP